MYNLILRDWRLYDKVRDYNAFPSDGSEDVLWRMYRSGDDLTEEREFDFWVISPKSTTQLISP